MDHAGGEFLAGTGRARNHDAAVGRRNALDLGPELIGDRRGTQKFGRIARALAQVTHLTAQVRGFKRAGCNEEQAVGLERLLDIVIGTALDGADGRFDVAVTGDHDDRQIRMLLLDGIEQCKAVKPAALQPDIEENQARAALRNRIEALVARCRLARAMPLIFENARNEFADVAFVVDDENI